MCLKVQIFSQLLRIKQVAIVREREPYHLPSRDNGFKDLPVVREEQAVRTGSRQQTNYTSSRLEKRREFLRAHVERLAFGIGRRAGRRIPEVAEAHESRQVGDSLAVLKDLGCHAIA